MSTAGLLVMIAGMAAVTLLSRVPPIVLAARIAPGPRTRRWLRQVPPAVMAAIVAPALLTPRGHLEISVTNPELMIGLATLAVAVLSRNFHLTIAFGVGAMAVVRLFVLPG